MAYAKCDNATHGNLAKVNNVPKANIASINSVGVPAAAGATMWAISSRDMWISWAATANIADVLEWEGNAYQLENNSSDTNDIAYGLDGNGGAKWMTVNNTNGDEIKFDGNNDITDESTWSTHNVSTDYGNNRLETIQYTGGDGSADSSSGNSVTRVGCWIACGRTSTNAAWIHRSVDGGANWTHLNLFGLTNIAGNASDADYHIRALAGDGTGNWMLAQRGNLYFSSDSGVSFSYLIQPTGAGTNVIRDIVYTNGTWCVLVNVGGVTYLYVCAGSTAANMDAAGDWGNTKMQDDPSDSNPAAAAKLTGTALRRMAGAGGRVVAVDAARSLAATVNGKATPVIEGTTQTLPDAGSLNTIATDGTIWLAGSDGDNVGADGGDICRSLDGGESWSLIVTGIVSQQRTVEGIAADVLLPL